MLYDLDMDGSVIEVELDEFGIFKCIFNFCFVQCSVDIFVGMLFNIVGYGIFIYFFVKIMGYMVGVFVYFGFDVYLYNNYMEGVCELMK